MSEQSLEWKCFKKDCGWTGTAPKRILDGIVACPDCGHSASMFCRAAEAVSGPPMSSDKWEVVKRHEAQLDCGSTGWVVYAEKGDTFVLASAHDAAVAGLEAERNERSAQLVAALARISQLESALATSFCDLREEVLAKTQRIGQLESEKAAANGLREGHALVVRKLEQRIAQLETALELHEKRDREQSMCVLYTHEEEEARNARIGQLEAALRDLLSAVEGTAGRHLAADVLEGSVVRNARALLPNILPNLPASGEG